MPGGRAAGAKAPEPWATPGCDTRQSVGFGQAFWHASAAHWRDGQPRLARRRVTLFGWVGGSGRRVGEEITCCVEERRRPVRRACVRIWAACLLCCCCCSCCYCRCCSSCAACLLCCCCCGGDGGGGGGGDGGSSGCGCCCRCSSPRIARRSLSLICLLVALLEFLTCRHTRQRRRLSHRAGQWKHKEKAVSPPRRQWKHTRQRRRLSHEQAVEAQGKGSVSATKAVETHKAKAAS